MNWFVRISLARKHIKRLSWLMSNPVYLEDLTAEWIVELGAGAAIFDHDGVLGPNKSHGPDEEGRRLLRDAVERLGQGKVFVLSNTKSRKVVRQAHYKDNHPDVAYLAARSKPDPEGLHMASAASCVPVEKVAVVDDGLLTGILMALEAGALPVYALRRSMAEPWEPWIIRMATTAPQKITVRALGLISG